mgnify:CR=1 FL=1
MATPQGIAVLAPITSGQADACQRVLDAINSDAEDSVTIDFGAQNRTHFARFVILPDLNRGEDAKRLLFSGIYDGSPEDFFRDMLANTSDLDAIWGHCEGWRGKRHYIEYMDRHNNPTGTFLKGFRFESVQKIQSYLQLRRDLIKKFDVPVADYDKVIRSLPTKPRWQATIQRWWRDASEFLYKVWVTLTIVPELIGLLRFGATLFEARRYLYDPIEIKRDYSYAPLDKTPPCHPLEEGDEVVPEKTETDLPQFLNRHQVQNQMTILTAQDPELIRRQEAMLAYIGTLAKIPFTNRNATIPTIHFGRWLMIDDSQRMLFLSNYDGSWESYIGDFVDKAANGLDAFWSGGLGWRDAATLDIELFKEGIRCHQTRASYFYSAYPDASVVNIGRARELARAYALNVDEASAREWLTLL